MPQVPVVYNIMKIYFCEMDKKISRRYIKFGVSFPDNNFPIDRTFYMTPPPTNEMLVQIRKLFLRKSCGPDSIRVKIVKRCPDIFAENIFDYS